jgi:hypothetical protein
LCLPRNWQLAKRYSDFVDLHEVLNDAGYGVTSIKKSLPPKKWFGNLEGDVIMFRQRALERYLTMCLQQAAPDDCSAVMQVSRDGRIERAFFGVGGTYNNIIE